MASRFVDLTLPLEDGMALVPGDPPVRVRPALRIADGAGVNVAALELGSHAGTHVDAPRHVDDEAEPIDAVGLDRLIGPTLVADVRAPAAGPAITGPELADALSDGAHGRILLLRTCADDGGTRHLSAGAAAAIVSAGPLAVGIDAMSIDAADDAALPAHQALLSAGIPVIENLVGIERLATLREPVLVVLPLPIREGDGAPARAVAVERAALIGRSTGGLRG